MRSPRDLAAFCWFVLFVSAAVAFSQPPELEDLLASARKAQTERNFETAAEYYRKAVALKPEVAELQTNLGLMYYQTGKDQQAIDALLQAIRLKPELFVPNLFLGLEYLKQKKFADALPYLERASKSNPADIQVQLALARGYTGAGKIELAIRSYVRASELEPGNANIWYHLGVVYLEQVEADARILLTKYRESSYMQVLVADNFAERHAFTQAAESYQQALSAQAVPPGTRVSYAFVLINQHDLPGAERELKSEFAANPASLWAKLARARLQVEQGATDEGAKGMAEVWRTDPGFLESNLQQFRAGMALPKRSELLLSLDQLRSAGAVPEPMVSLFRSGELVGKSSASTNPTGDDTAKGELSGSSKHAAPNATDLYNRGEYRKCSDLLAPRLPALTAKHLGLLAFCAYATGDYRHAFDAGARLAAASGSEAKGLYWETKASQRLAAAALSHASEIDPGSTKLHILLGDIYRQQKRLQDAEQEYRKALSLQPHDTGALFGLSLALLADGQNDDAFHVAQAALVDHPNDAEFNAVIGEILCQRDQYAEAEVYLKKSLDTKPEYVSHVHALLGKIYANTDRLQEAIAELKLALPEDNDGHLYYQIGRLYLRVGDRPSAEEAFTVSKRLEREGLNRTGADLRPDQFDAEFQ